VEDTTITAKDASVSVYQLAKFTTNATFRTAILRLQQEFYWIIFGPYVERLMAFTLAENSLGLRVDKEIADSCFIPVPEQAQALVDGYAELLARFSTWLAEPEALTVSSLYTDTRPPIRLPNPDGPGLVVLSLTETEMAFLKSRCAEAIANALAGSVKLTKPTHRYQKLKHFVEYLFVTNFLTRKDALALPTDDMRRVYRETITAAVSQGVAAFCAGQVENCYAIYLAGIRAAASRISASIHSLTDDRSVLRSCTISHFSKPRVHAILRSRRTVSRRVPSIGHGRREGDCRVPSRYVPIGRRCCLPLALTTTAYAPQNPTRARPRIVAGYYVTASTFSSTTR